MTKGEYKKARITESAEERRDTRIQEALAQFAANPDITHDLDLVQPSATDGNSRAQRPSYARVRCKRCGQDFGSLGDVTTKKDPEHLQTFCIETPGELGRALSAAAHPHAITKRTDGETARVICKCCGVDRPWTEALQLARTDCEARQKKAAAPKKRSADAGPEPQRKVQAKEHGRDSEVKKKRKFAEAELADPGEAPQPKKLRPPDIAKKRKPARVTPKKKARK